MQAAEDLATAPEDVPSGLERRVKALGGSEPGSRRTRFGSSRTISFLSGFGFGCSFFGSSLAMFFSTVGPFGNATSRMMIRSSAAAAAMYGTKAR